jgi:hypothetical protein
VTVFVNRQTRRLVRVEGVIWGAEQDPLKAEMMMWLFFPFPLELDENDLPVYRWVDFSVNGREQDSKGQPYGAFLPTQPDTRLYPPPPAWNPHADMVLASFRLEKVEGSNNPKWVLEEVCLYKQEEFERVNMEDEREATLDDLSPLAQGPYGWDYVGPWPVLLFSEPPKKIYDWLSYVAGRCPY